MPTVEQSVRKLFTDIVRVAIQLAESGIATAMESYCTNVTFDIIGEVITNIDCKAQDETVKGNDIVKNFTVLGATFANDNGLTFAWANIPLQIRRYIYSKRLEKVSRTRKLVPASADLLRRELVGCAKLHSRKVRCIEG